MSKLKKALQRATEARSHIESKNSFGDEKHIHPLLSKHVVYNESSDQKKIEITYSKTRVENIDKEVLRQNKVFSLFKANKTTDQIDILRTQLLSKLSEMSGNSFLVTSCHPGEGKTFTSINLGVSIAQQLDRTVLIIDTDFRNPWKYHVDFAGDYWGIKPEKGLADYLMGEAEIEEILVNPGIQKLTIVPAGKPMLQSAELLSSKRMERFILDVKNRYSDRICIFDSPALLRCTDPLVFTHLIDGVLLVVEAEKTTPDDIKKILQLLKDKQILGTVFNKSKEKISSDYV